MYGGRGNKDRTRGEQNYDYIKIKYRLAFLLLHFNFFFLMTNPLYMSQKEISIVITMCKMYYFNFMIIIIIKNKKSIYLIFSS